jgi:hypothetical protein
MHIAGVTIMSLAIVCGVLLFSWSLLNTYIDKRESSALTSFISTIAVAITLLCVMLIPVDIYIVSSDLNADGSQSNPDLTHASAQAIQSIYYALYITLLSVQEDSSCVSLLACSSIAHLVAPLVVSRSIFAFMLLPFTYFYVSITRCIAACVTSQSNREKAWADLLPALICLCSTKRIRRTPPCPPAPARL